MKQPLQLLLLACIIAGGAHAQTDTAFLRQKQIIDAQVAAIDSSTGLMRNIFTGTLIWGNFHANGFYYNTNKQVVKAEYFFEDKAAGKKVFYYNNDILIKVNDNGVEYYCINSTLSKDGRSHDATKEDELLIFSQESRKLLQTVMQ